MTMYKNGLKISKMGWLPNDGRRHVPLWSLVDIARRFDIKVGTLAALIRHRGGPAPILRRGTSHKTAYYDLPEMLKWYEKCVKDRPPRCKSTSLTT